MSSRGRSPQRTALIVVLVAAVVALAAGTYFATNRSDSSGGVVAAGPDTQLKGMAFLGDSFTEGTGADSPQQGWAPTAAKSLGYIPAIIAQGGAGFVTANPEGLDTRNLAQRVNDIAASLPDVVVVAAGLNDANRNYPPERIANAVGSTLNNLRQAVGPDTPIIVVGPFWPSGQPTPSALAVRDIVKSRADANKMAFIDPIAEQWITGSTDGTTPGNRAQYIGSDGTHPTPNGHVYIASRFVQDMKARNLIPVGTPAAQ